MEKITSIFLITLLLKLIFAEDYAINSTVTEVTPPKGSVGGGMKLTLRGTNFANDQYAKGVGNENLGNTVILTDRYSEIPCDVFREDTTPVQIVCYTRRGMKEGQTYWVKVFVNGKPIPSENMCNNEPYGEDCSYTASWWNTPYFETIQPQSGTPGDDFLVNLTGQIITNRFGSDTDDAPNGRTEKITRVYCPDQCDLKDGDKFFGLWVADDSFDGYMVVRPNTTFIGLSNITMMVEFPFGRSVTKPELLRISYNQTLYSIQYHSRVDTVSPQQGSKAGHTTLRLTGPYYELGGENSTYKRMRIYVGDTECEITKVEEDEYAECTVAPEPEVTLDNYEGGRGLNVEHWPDGSFLNLEALKNAASTTDMEHFDMSGYKGEEINFRQTRMIGRFKPPLSGFYSFQVKSTYQAALYIDGKEQAISSGNWESGDQMLLDQNQSYQLMVVAMGPSSNPNLNTADTPPSVEASCKFFSETKFTSAWTINVFQEEHILRYSSVPTPDVQRFSFSNTDPQQWTPQEQKICVEGASFDISIGLFGAFTGVVGVNEAPEVQLALNQLPSIHETENIEVEQISEQCIKVTIISPRGNFPPFEVAGEDISATVEILTEGIPDNDFVSLDIGGQLGRRPSMPFPVSELDEAMLQEVVESMFETKCPEQFFNGGNLFQSFEGDPSWFRFGEVTNEIEAFCGKKSIKTPRKLYPFGSDDDEISFRPTQQRLYVCFAYSGLSDPEFVYKYKDSEDRHRWERLPVTSLQTELEGNLWDYTCIELSAALENRNLIEARLEGSYEEEFFVDALYFGQKPTVENPGNISSRRLRPAPLGRQERALIDHVEVTYDDITNEYFVSLYPLHCRYDFGLFELLNKEGDSLTGDSGSTTLNFGSTTLSVTRLEWASPPPQGTFKLVYEDQESPEMSTSFTNEQIRDVLQAFPNAGIFSVEDSEDSTCANVDKHITFLSEAGDKELMQLKDKVLTAPPSASVEILPYQDGHVLHRPIMGDLLRTEHKFPQVNLYLNDIPSSCPGDCTFQWTDAATPTVTGLNINTGTVDDVLEITGTKFSTNQDENSVTIGGTSCDVTASTDTLITCTVGDGSGRNEEVRVLVAGLGLAAGSQTFSYIQELVDIEPKSCSFGGGCSLTAIGRGFSDTLALQVGGNPCETKERSTSQLICSVPPSGILSEEGQDRTVDVELLDAERPIRKREAAILKLTYVSSMTSIVVNLNKQSFFSVRGGEDITAIGTNFGTNLEIFISDKKVEVEQRSDDGAQTSLIFKTPPSLRPGFHILCINKDGKGCAVLQETGARPQLTVVLEVTSFSPMYCSVHGGCNIAIRGNGFGTVEDGIDIKFGDYPCMISDVTNEEIKCQMSGTGREKVIKNFGSKGYTMSPYNFEERHVTVLVGDTITWQWTTPDSTDIKLRIVETTTESSTETVKNGVDSGSARKSGTYGYTFTRPGKYYYWNGLLDSDGTKSFRGTVTVKVRTSSSEQLVVKVMEQEAHYVTGQQASTSSNDCSVTSKITTCRDQISNSKQFVMVLSSCYTPVVKSITFDPAVEGTDQAVTTSTKFTVFGEGFASSLCAIEVKLGRGEQACYGEILQSPQPTTSKFAFKPQSACTLPSVGILKEISVLIKNRGYAEVRLEQYKWSVAFLPSITKITPAEGSTEGGTEVEISGTGFKDVDKVMFSGTSAIDPEIESDTSIKCVSPKSSTGPVGVKKGDFSGVCDSTDGENCFFKYHSSKTPIIRTVNPTSINSADEQTLTFVGTNFGTIENDVTAVVGGESCEIETVSDTSLTCKLVSGVPAGPNKIVVTRKQYGIAQTTVTVLGELSVRSLSQNSGSKHGGHVLTVSGDGFHKKGTVVSIAGKDCEIKNVSLSEIVCDTPAHDEEEVELKVTVPDSSVSSAIHTYTYTAELDDVSVTPTSGTAGDTVTVKGSNFGSDAAKVHVTFGGAKCSQIQEFSSKEFKCTLGSHSSGQVSGRVLVEDYGYSNEVTLAYEVTLDDVTPKQGCQRGNQLLTLTGRGFSVDEDIKVQVCGELCPLLVGYTVTPNELVCVTPEGAGESCDVTILYRNGVTKKDKVYSYTSDISCPTIESVEPDRGGTGGGVRITIAGSGFGTDSSDVQVTLDGNECTVDENYFSAIEIQCITPAHTGTIETNVVVEVGQNGGLKKRATEDSPGASNFWYIDAWSSPYTWGNKNPPEAGDLVVVSKGFDILLDTDTAVLAQLLINGGKVKFDCSKKVELKSRYIFIDNGGILEAGTEDKPCEGKAIITLFGHARSIELPVYGSKVLALRNGGLELHGKEIPTTWTLLTQTAEKGAREISLPWHAVDGWAEKDEIVIASTGDRHSQKENEKHKIKEIARVGDDAILTLEEELEYTHTGETETFDEGKVSVEMRAEVGLLTRTVVVRGSENEGWDGEIEACEDGFDTGEHVVQTCFQGRFGKEIGSDQFGAHIMVHQTEKDTQVAVAHIEYIEVTNAGQAFHLGRYPIHFHLNGLMDKSYVRGCSIHKSFNRAVNIHGTHHTLVEWNVAYDIMGGAFFLEDGIEVKNIFQYNVLVFVKASTSLLNDDITPAAFWVTNPDNIVRHNHAAGGTHFGFWYRMHVHPDGPSYTDKYCPRRVPLGEFYNNTAHSFGWFGVWLFQEYVPMKNGKCQASVSDAEAAKFNRTIVWNTEKGFEYVDGGGIQVHNSIFLQCKLSGLEGIKLMYTASSTENSENRPVVEDTYIIGHPNSDKLKLDTHGVTRSGIVIAFGVGLKLENVKFINFDDPASEAMHFAKRGLCPDNCGGYDVEIKNFQVHEVKFKGKFRWQNEGIFKDIDGSLTGISNSLVLPYDESLPKSCETFSQFNSELTGAATCPGDIKFYRFAFNGMSPSSLEGKDVTFTNDNGKKSAPYRVKRLTHKEGWMALLLGDTTHTMEFEDAPAITNISLNGQIHDLGVNARLGFKIRAFEKPDRFSLEGGDNPIEMSSTDIDLATATHGQWYYDEQEQHVHFALVGPSPSGGTHKYDYNFLLTFYKCFFKDCNPPIPDDDQPLKESRPSPSPYWDMNIWTKEGNTFISAATAGGGSQLVTPGEDIDVTISKDDWIVLRKTEGVLRLRTVFLHGTLEISDLDSDNADKVHSITVDFIIIKSPGRLIGGWPDKSYKGTLTITLAGTVSSPYYDNQELEGATVGAKAIAGYGGLDLIGKDYGDVWTTLTATVEPGGKTLKVSHDVSEWPDDGTIIVTSTSSSSAETEEVQIESATGNTIHLKDGLQYRHIGSTEEVAGTTYEFSAAVGLLTRNIKVQADPEQSEKVYGGRVLISIAQDTATNQVHTGFARLENVEFVHMGQDGFTEEYDPRYAVTFFATGEVKENKPSYVRRCSFHTLYNTAVGLYGTKGLPVTENVVYQSLGTSILSASSHSSVDHNLVSNTLATASYNGRNEEFNSRYEVGIDMFDAEDSSTKGNYVAASERGGYRLAGSDCESPCEDYNDDESNVAVGCLMGLRLFPEDPSKRDRCNSFCGMKLWKNLDYGVYVNNPNSVQISNMVLADNQVGIFAFVSGPSSVNHICEHKTVTISNSVVIGYLSSSDCSKPSGSIYGLTEHCRGPAGPDGEYLGIIFGQFSEGSNKAAVKPCAGVKRSNSLCGCTKVDGVTFKNFGKHPIDSCPGSFAISSNPSNDDLEHPMTVSNIVKEDVDEKAEVLYHRPNIKKVTPADCVDMDCDAKKKLLLKDTDGGLLGDVSVVLPNSEWEWDGDSRRGLGDYRIPRALLTDSDGSKLDYDKVRDKKGIPRDGCELVKHEYSQAEDSAEYRCQTNLHYKMLVIESMDNDTMTRRLSPVAVRQKLKDERYIDLINGPQDHGCCAGYSCQRRLSTFHAIVVTGQDDPVEIYLSSTTPDKMRFFFVDPDKDSCAVIALYRSEPNRVDVFSNDGSVPVVAKNARIKNDRLIVDSELSTEEYMPKCSDEKGANFIDRQNGLTFGVLKGDDKLQFVLNPQIIVALNFETVLPEEFFAVENIENSMARLLNVPTEKIRIVNIVSASGNRRKRSSGTVVRVEIGNQQAASADETSQERPTSLGAAVMTACQDMTIEAVLAVEGTTCEEVIVDETTYVPRTPESLQFYQQLVPQREGAVFSTQPKLRAYDSLGVIENLGIKEDPWQMTATIRSGTGHAEATLGGTVTVDYVDGWFNFTDLSVSHAGQNYIIEFDISKPTSAIDLNVAVASAAFDVEAVPLKAELYSMTSSDIIEGTGFSLTLELQDEITGKSWTDIAWRGHVFNVNCGLLNDNEISTVSGDLNITYDELTARAQFDDITISGFGPTYLECHVVSTPAEYDFQFFQKVYVLATSQIGLLRDTSQIITLRFIEEFGTILLTDAHIAQLEQIVLQTIVQKYPGIIIIDSALTEGSILITFTVEGPSGNVTSMMQDLCTSVSNGQSFTLGSTTLTLDHYMSVDGQDYYGATCGAGESKDGRLHPGYIALIAVLVALVLIFVIVLLIWKFKVRPKTQTHEIFNTRFNPEVADNKYTCSEDNGKTVYLGGALHPEGTFSSMVPGRENTLYTHHVNVDLRQTPSPNPDKVLYGRDATTLTVPPLDTRKHTQMKVSPAPSPVPPRANQPVWKY